MGKRDKELIESNYGALWSGSQEITVMGKALGIRDVLRAIDLDAGDIVPIDVVKLGEDRFALRYFDGDDRCVVALEMDRRYRITSEHRAHVAEWLEDTYHGIGREAISPYELVSYLMDLYGVEDR
ncbi:MAG: hypothetical protein GTN70_00345 [Deltaproteobacteria bacterium]|nr:hypothetical protein [Deltaproteobacteria bacterium]NIS76109.1 hypothetical protein [Deltaproteobacteria bacterium]